MTGGWRGYEVTVPGNGARQHARHHEHTVRDDGRAETRGAVDMNLGAAGMAVFLVLLALVLIGAFAAVWHHDRRRSHVLGDDESRQDTETASRIEPPH